MVCPEGAWPAQRECGLLRGSVACPEGAWPADTLILAYDTDFGLLAPRTVREYVYFILNHHVCGHLLQIKC